jgi:hypothetical protein
MISLLQDCSFARLTATVQRLNIRREVQREIKQLKYLQCFFQSVFYLCPLMIEAVEDVVFKITLGFSCDIPSSAAKIQS